MKSQHDAVIKHVGRLSAAARKALPQSDFALPGGRFPIENEEHGRKAIQMAPHASPSEQATIKRKVHQRYPGIKIDSQ